MTFQHRTLPLLLTLLACATVLGGLATSPARADWREPVGGAAPINADDARNASAVALATVDGAPHVAWTEDTTEPGQGNSNGIDVARLSADGTAWTRLAPGSPITRLATASTSAPSLTDVEGFPWVTWAENSDSGGRDIHVARLAPSGAKWLPMDDGDHRISRDPSGRASDIFGRPSIAASGSRPYVAFWELDPGTGSLLGPLAPGGPYAPGKVWVMRLGADGKTWEEVGGGPVNVDPDHDALVPALAIIDGRPWVSYLQVAFPGPSPVLQVRMARLSDSGTGWTQVGAPLVEMPPGQTEPQESPIAPVDGVPRVAVANAGRIEVFRAPAAGGSEWQPVGDGPASLDAPDASFPGLISIGDVPWVSWNQSQGGMHAARLVDGKWDQAGSPIGGSRGKGSIASINGFPWIAFTQDDGTAPGNPGCCSQVRVTRLEPTFGASRAFPSADTAALLAGVEAFGLPYPIGFEYGEEGATERAGMTAPKAADGPFTIGEARDLRPSTLYWFRPFATAGTPLPLARGTRENFATPPSSAAAAPPGTIAPQTTVISTPARLVVAIVRATTRVRRGARVRIRVLSTEPGTAQLTVVRGRRVVRTITRSVRAGTQTLIWGTRRATPARYRLRVRVRSSDGRSASDAVNVRVLRRKSTR